MTRLLKAGAKYQARDRSTGNQALHEAAQGGHTEVSKNFFFWIHEAYPTFFWIHEAAQGGRTEVCKKLVEV